MLGKRVFHGLLKLNMLLIKHSVKYVLSHLKLTSGVAQVRSHNKCHKAGANESYDVKQKTFKQSLSGEVALTKNKCLYLSPEEYVIKAEPLQALHMVHKNPFLCKC